LNEAMETQNFMKKPFELVESSRQYIEGLWKIGIYATEFGTSVASLFSSISNLLIEAVIRVGSLSKEIFELSLVRFMLLPPFDLWLRKVAPSEGEYFPIETGRANVSFIFNVNIARKIAAELARRVAARTPKPLLFEAAIPEAELKEEKTEGYVKEPTITLPYIVGGLQSRLVSKLAPTIKSMMSILQEYGGQAVLPTQLFATPAPFLIEPQVHTSEMPFAVPSQAPSLPSKETKVEPSLPHAKVPTKMIVPPVSIPFERLRPEVVSSMELAARLPGIVLEWEFPILERMAAFSLVSPERVVSPQPSMELPYHYAIPSTPTPMRPSQIERLLKEVSPSLTSWIYGLSEVLRGTAFSLSAVPVAASTAERVVAEALIQPVSKVEVPSALEIQEPISRELMPSRAEVGVGRTEVEAFRLPAIVTSLIATLAQRYPLLVSEPRIGEVPRAPFERMHVVPEETPMVSRVPEAESFSKLPTVIALAAAESLIAHRLQQEFRVFTKEMQVARSDYGERLGELGAFGPIRVTMLDKLAAAAPAFPPTVEPYSPGFPSTPPLSRPSPSSPTVQNTFNITISGESTEEDLRDLERKISKILSEQIRRHYGSTRFEEV